MNINEILELSILDLESRWELPKTGFLSGGSLANIVWEKISGNKSVVNDIDIYRLKTFNPALKPSDSFRKQNFKKTEKVVFEDYSGISFMFKTSEIYIIDSVSNDGIFNYIDYESNTTDRQIIIESFDINCCQVGYDLETKKFYWTEAFEDFLKTGELRLANLSTPAHSALRLVKKKKDLGAKLPEIELDIISFTLNKRLFVDTTKYRFKVRYANMFEDFKGELENRFILKEDKELIDYLREAKNIDEKIYCIESISNELPQLVDSEGTPLSTSHLVGLNLSTDFLFWVRNIFKNQFLEKRWFNLHLIFDTKLGIDGYFDCQINDMKMEFMNRLCRWAPNCVGNLLGLPLSKQLKIVEKLVSKFKDDPIIAITILEEHKIIEGIDLDNDMDILLLELSVRKKILEDTRDKVRRIFENGVDGGGLLYSNTTSTDLPF